MSIRSLSLKTTALLAFAAATFPAAALQSPAPALHGVPIARTATGVATSIVLIVTTPSPRPYGGTVDGYAQVTSSDGSTLPGTVPFYDGSVNICAIPVTQTTSCPASAGAGFLPGTHILTAVYSGDSAHLAATSDAVPVVVLPDPTAITLAASVNPAAPGQSVTFSASVAAAQSLPLAPTGAVTFLDGPTILGTSAVNSSGLATFSTAALTAGSHTITATYAGDAATGPSSSAPLSEVISASAPSGQTPFTVIIKGTPTVATGSSVNLLVTVAPQPSPTQPGPIQPVQLSCADLPAESACTFSTPTLPINGGTTSLQISTMQPHSCASNTAPSAAIPFAGPVLAGLLLFLLPRRTRRPFKNLLAAILAICGLAALSGCGNCTDLGTRPGDYTIKVIATSTATATNRVVTKIVLHVTVP